MIESANEAGLPTDPEFRAAFVSYIEWGTRHRGRELHARSDASTAHAGAALVVGLRRHTRAHACRRSQPTATPATKQPVRLPDPTTTPSFTTHIKPLFRTKDRQSMRFAFDLWSHDDVSQQADAILAQLRAGTMPCDGAWPPERIDVFERWIAAGTPP